MTSSQTVPVQTYTRVNFGSVVFSRAITVSGNALILPCGGFYSIDAKVRVDVGASGVVWLQLRVVTPGGNKVINEYMPSNVTVMELEASITKLMPKGSIYAEIYAYGGTGTISVLSTGDANWLSCVLVG
jgi:hypothetical protein